MGNITSLFTTNPAEILPVEVYLSDLACDAVENLGSTRFMKVARGRTHEGVFVYKVFVRQDQTPLDPYPQKIIDIRKALQKSPNCCPIKRILVKQKCAVMVRAFQKHTLFDRMSTRPFVVEAEKLWYMFLLFKALSQCETAGVCHGDLKSQNVLISSTNWLQITDFAPFKPCFLTQDNPSAFTFFFDTSRRQSCYIAPERFISANQYEKEYQQNGDQWLFGSLTPKMDMFSAGCIVFELLCDRTPFTYSSLCEYRSMSETDASTLLASMVSEVPKPYQTLVRTLLSRDPSRRPSANAVLTGATLSFPRILEDFLFRYLDRFRPLYGTASTSSADQSPDDFSQPMEFSYLEPDDVIAKLKKEKRLWWAKLAESDENKAFSFLFVSLITANLRALRTIQAKTDACQMLVELSTLCDSSVAIDRILPYFVHLWADPETQVRATGVTATAKLLAPIQPKTYEEALVFVDYLFPQLNVMANDSVDCPQHVLFAIATSLGSFADTAYRFLISGREIRSASPYDDDDNSDNVQNDDANALLHGVSAIFSALCSKDPMVKRCLVETRSLVLLYQFFIKIGNDDTLLRFLCTFLNAKTEWRLRAAFFDSLPTCVQKRSEGMVPLLQLGLQDFEEHVVVRALGCIHILIKNENLDKRSVGELLKDVLPFFVHPNDWIRAAVCDIILVIDSQWHQADTLVRLIPLVSRYIEESKRAVLSLKSKTVLMGALVDPIPRTIFNQICELSIENTKQLTMLLEIHFETKKPFEAQASWFNTIFPKIKTDTTTGSIVDHNDVNAAIEARKRLTWAVFEFRHLFEKMAETRNTAKAAEKANPDNYYLVINAAGMEVYLTRQHGTIDLSANVHLRVRRKDFIYGCEDTGTSMGVIKFDKINVPNHGIERRDTLMIGGEVVYEEEQRTHNTVGGGGGHNSYAPVNNNNTFESQVNEMLAHLNELHMKNVSGRSRRHPPYQPLTTSSTSNLGALGAGGAMALTTSASAPSVTMGTSQGASVRGIIITHLHEHSKQVTRLSASPDGDAFLSGSADGTVKIWKTRTLLGEGYGAARSEDTWNPTDGRRELVNSVGWNDRFICSATEDGHVRWADIGQGGTRLISSVRIPVEEGPPVYLHCNGPMVVIRTHHGVLYGLDLRVGASEGPLKRHDIWRKKFQETHGLVTTSAIDPWQQSWMVIGNNTQSKNMMLYDLRFREEVLRWEAPHQKLQPLAIWANPVSRQESPEIYVGFSMHGEVSSYELGAQPVRKRVLWTGGTPILSYNSSTTDSRQQDGSQLMTRALCVCEKTGMVYTGDTRGAIRKWNTHRAAGCEVLSAPPKGRTAYRTMFEEHEPATSNDPLVIYERTVMNTDAKENRKIVPLDAKPSTHHRTPITDMMLLNSELMVSSGFDGVIKVWK